MGKWEEAKLGEIAFTKSGGTPKRSFKKYWENGKIPWLKSGELDDNKNIIENSEYITEEAIQNSSAKVFPKGSLLLAMYGATAGKLGILGMDAATNQAVCSIQNRKGLFDERFVFNFLLLIRDEIIRDSFGGAQPNISKTYIDNIKIPLPPLPEQQRIVAKLDGLFAKIDQATSLLEANLQHTQALMGSVLDEEFGKLEAKYGKIELVSLCDKITDGSHHSPKAIEKGFPYVTVKDVTWEGKIDTVHCKKISKSDFEELEKNGCKPILGDVLLSKDGTVGKVAIVDFDMDWVVLSSLAIIRPNKSKLDTTFLSWMLKTPIIQELAIGLKTGAAIKRIVLRTIKKIEIPVPKDLKEQKRISDYFEKLNRPYQTLLETQTQKLNHLKALKSSLLDQAFKGEL